MVEYRDYENKKIKRAPHWLARYIETKGNIENTDNDNKVAKIIGVSYSEIYDYVKVNPWVQEMIGDRIAGQKAKLRERALKSLFARLSKSDKLIQLALEMSGDHTNKSEITTRIDNMDKEALARELKARFSKIMQSPELEDVRMDPHLIPQKQEETD